MEKSGKAEGFTCQIRVVPLLNTNKQNQSEITFTAKVLVQFSSQFFWECGDEFRAFTDKKGEIGDEEELNLTEEFGQVASFFSKFKLCFSVIYKKNAIKVITESSGTVQKKILRSPLERDYFNIQISGLYVAYNSLHEYSDY